MTDNEIFEQVNEEDYKVIYINHVGVDSDGNNVYHFLLSTDCEETWAEPWYEVPACNINKELMIPPKEQYEYIKELRTDIKLILAQENCCGSMQDARDHCFALAYEDLSEYEEYPEDGRIVIQFGECITDIESDLARRDLRLRYV